MISAWWLWLIITVSACVGYLLCGLMLTARILDETDIDSDNET